MARTGEQIVAWIVFYERHLARAKADKDGVSYTRIHRERARCQRQLRHQMRMEQER